MSYLENLPNTPITRRNFLIAGGLLATGTWSLARSEVLAQEHLSDELQASYAYSFETVTFENKEQMYPHYEIGENIATIAVFQGGEPKNLTIQASVGINWTLREMGTNSINASWFTNGVFDHDSFSRHVAEPITQSINNYLDGVTTTVTIKNMPDTKSGETDSYITCAEVKKANFRIDTRHINNPNSDEWQSLSDTEKALMDRAVIYTPAHETLHIKLASMGTPPYQVGEEAIGEAFAHFRLRDTRHLWHSEISETVVKDNSHVPFFENSNLRMEGTGSQPYAGYEHNLLVKWLLESNNLSWPQLLEKINEATQEEQNLGCPIEAHVNVLSRVFSQKPWENILAEYLGQVLKPFGSEYNDIFGIVRRNLSVYTKQLSLFEGVDLQPDYFSFYDFYSYIDLPTNPKQHLILKTDQDIVTAFIDNGETVILGKNDDLTPYLIDNPDGGRNLKIAILNPGTAPLHVSIEPVIYDNRLNIPFIKNHQLQSE